MKEYNHNPYYRLEFTFGTFELKLPSKITMEEIQDIEDYFNLILKQLKRINMN